MSLALHTAVIAGIELNKVAQPIPISELLKVQEATRLRGYIDGVTPNGVIEGWAFDEKMPWRPVQVSIRCGDESIASGFAHHYREDLVAAQMGTGWCCFKLWSGRSLNEIRGKILHAVGLSGDVIWKSDDIALLPDVDLDLELIEDVVAADPTIVRSVEQLRGCKPLFTQYILSRGIDAFVRAAYVYILGRPVDDTGLRIYGGHLRRGTHTPFELMHILSMSEEFIRNRPELIAPTQPSFPFLVDQTSIV